MLAKFIRQLLYVYSMNDQRFWHYDNVILVLYKYYKYCVVKLGPKVKEHTEKDYKTECHSDFNIITTQMCVKY